jgi:hypothetical protein
MQKYIHKESGKVIQAAPTTEGESHGELVQLPANHWKIFNEDGSPQHIALSDRAFKEDYEVYSMEMSAHVPQHDEDNDEEQQ